MAFFPPLIVCVFVAIPCPSSDPDGKGIRGIPARLASFATEKRQQFYQTILVCGSIGSVVGLVLAALAGNPDALTARVRRRSPLI